MSAGSIGTPRLQLRRTDSTNLRARELAVAGAPHGTLVTADYQEGGRGRQGRTWVAPAGRALLCSIVLRSPPRLLSLAAGVAVAETVEAMPPPEPAATISPVALKWPNDVWLGGRKVAGILIEGRPQEDWAVLGIGVNVALRPEDFPLELRPTAGTLALAPAEIDGVLERLVAALGQWLAAPGRAVLDAFGMRDALVGRPVRWQQGGTGAASTHQGTGAGVDGDGRLLVRLVDGTTLALDSGEVHLVDT